MEWNLEKSNNGRYLLETKSYYDTVIQGKNFIVAHNQEREELIVYNKDLIMTNKYSVKTVKEYKFEDAVFALLDRHILLALDGNNLSIFKLVDNFNEPAVCREIKRISSKKYLVVSEFKKENVEFCQFAFLIINFNQETPSTKEIERCEYAYHFKGNDRFLECDNFCLHDLYAERRLELPKNEILLFISKTQLTVEYANKEVLMLTFRLESDAYPIVYHCLYINGKLVYIYDEGTEYQEILPKLQKLSESTCNFKTLVIKNQVLIWTADGSPEVIPADSFLKANQ